MSNPRRPANKQAAYWLALLAPAALLGGALVSQYLFGLPPCEMCWWQRYPHGAALVLALAAFAMRSDWLVRLAALAVLVSGAIGGYHAGVEYGWWDGLTRCATGAVANGDPLASIMNAPVIRCDVAPWSLLGISLAGWNFLISGAAGLSVLVLLARRSSRKTGMMV